MKDSFLIIGHLLWDKLQFQKDWRNDFLDVSNGKSVSVSIRYGRLFKDRGIYTMAMVLKSFDAGLFGGGFWRNHRPTCSESLYSVKYRDLTNLYIQLSKSANVSQTFALFFFP